MSGNRDVISNILLQSNMGYLYTMNIKMLFELISEAVVLFLNSPFLLLVKFMYCQGEWGNQLYHTYQIDIINK